MSIGQKQMIYKKDFFWYAVKLLWDVKTSAA